MTDINTSICPFIVPSGGPLTIGKLYLQLYHGRKDPAEQLDDWGFVGPTFGPLAYVVQTYMTTIRLHDEHDRELCLDLHDDLVAWDGTYYGDFSIFIATEDDRNRQSAAP